MSDHGSRLSSLFHAAVARPLAERLDFVHGACRNDDALREELEALLALDGAAAGFLEPVDLVGQVWGAYAIRARLGVGGMGEVYRAHDPKLDRDVALKVLPSVVSGDPERRARLAREARLLATLNHPHIAAIYGLEEREGAVALVLELVEGTTLAQQLERGALPLPDALVIARQIGQALQAAHESGVVHRDLKPANVVVQRSADGSPHAKVLDFGLAKPLGKGESSPGSLGDTTHGRILGTPAYMSPEQARGHAVDRRADIWAFGCLLFEMLSGVQPFAAATVPDTLARLLDHEPDWFALPHRTPASIRRLLERCLRKDPGGRLHDIGDALIELDDAVRPIPRRRILPALHPRIGWAVSMAGALAIVVVGGLVTRPRPAAPEPVVFAIPPSPGSNFTGTAPGFAVSPDGRHLAWAAATDGISRVWVRAIDSLEARSLPGTEGALAPFWRPDSRRIGFFARGMLKMVSVEGGSPVTLGTGTFGFWTGGAWNDRGDVLFTSGCCLWHVKAGQPAPPPRQVTTTTRDEIRHLWPAFLPDGDRFLYFVERETTNEVRVRSLSTGEARPLGTFESHVVFDSGYLFYVRGGNLTAQTFDPASLRLEGDPWVFGVQAGIDPPWQHGMFSVAPTALAYRGVARAPSVLTWVNRSGKVLETIGEPAVMYNINLSFDDKRVVVSRLTDEIGQPAQTDVWVVAPSGGAPQRLTQGRAWEWDPAWSPDGRYTLFTSDPVSRWTPRLYVRPSTRTGDAVLLDDEGITAPEWSADGRHIMYTKGGETGFDLWTIDMSGNRKPTPFLKTPSHEQAGTFSPDGKWVAYDSNFTGRWEVYLRRFPVGEEAIRISTEGGRAPRWRGDGKELFFVALDGVLTAVDVDLAHGVLGQSRALFPGVGASCCRQYAVARDGQRFLLLRPAGDPPPLSVVLNWQAQLHP
jgi:Tol biopolymer transport system component